MFVVGNWFDYDRHMNAYHKSCKQCTHFHPESHRFLIQSGNILRFEKSKRKLDYTTKCGLNSLEKKKTDTIDICLIFCFTISLVSLFCYPNVMCIVFYSVSFRFFLSFCLKNSTQSSLSFFFLYRPECLQIFTKLLWICISYILLRISFLEIWSDFRVRNTTKKNWSSQPTHSKIHSTWQRT